jgi:hypothetical protein
MLPRIPESLRSELGYDLARLRLMVDAGIVNRAMDDDAALWPSFVEHDDCVIVAARFMPGNFEEWFEGLKGDRRAVEAELNHLYILDLFECRDNWPTRHEILWLAKLVKKLWLAKLTIEFPNRQFIVSFPVDAHDHFHSRITFHQSDVVVSAEEGAARTNVGT